MKTKKRTHNFGSFDAKFLWCLQPFVEWGRGSPSDKFIDGNIFIEPAPIGGVYLSAITEHAAAIFHDPHGTVSEPATLCLPDKAFEAAEAPHAVEMNYCGTQYAVDLPEWAWPGTCYVYDAGMHIVPKMRHPQWAEADDEFWPCLFSSGSSHSVHFVGRDYRMTLGTPANWRKPLLTATNDPGSTAATRAFSPALAALFHRIQELFCKIDGELPRVWHRASSANSDGSARATIVTFENHPEFVGMYMPMLFVEPPPIAGHFTIRAHEGTETKQ